MPTIKTKKFTLRLLKLTDAKDITKNVSNKKISFFTISIPYPYALKDAKWFLKESILGYKKGTRVNFGIVINKEVVGVVSLEKIIKNHKAELGYWLTEKYWGQGIMSLAVKKNY